MATTQSFRRLAATVLTVAASVVAAVPAIAQWEAALLVAGGRLELERPAREWIAAAASQAPFAVSPLSPDIAVAAADPTGTGAAGRAT